MEVLRSRAQPPGSTANGPLRYAAGEGRKLFPDGCSAYGLLGLRELHLLLHRRHGGCAAPAIRVEIIRLEVVLAVAHMQHLQRSNSTPD